MAPAQIPDFNVFDALGIAKPGPELSFHEIRKYYKEAMLVTHPDRQFALPGAFPSVLQVGQAYDWLVEADQERKNQLRFYEALSEYAGTTIPYKRTFFPERRRQGAPKYEIFTSFQAPAQPAGGFQADHQDSAHAEKKGSASTSARERKPQDYYGAYGNNPYADFMPGASQDDDDDSDYKPSTRSQRGRRRTAKPPKAHAAPASAGNDNTANTAAGDVPSPASIFIGWPVNQMKRQLHNRQAVWATLDGNGKMFCRVRRTNHRGIEVRGYNSHHASIRHDRIAYRDIFAGMTHAGVQAEVERLSALFEGNISKF